MSISHPTETAEITPALIEAALREWGLLGDARVLEAHTSPVGDEGELAQTVRVTITAEGSQLPPTLIAKFAAGFPPVRRFADAMGAYQREVRFYSDLATDVGMPAPRCYFAGHDMEQHTFLLLLEDLDAGRIGSVFALSVEDAREAVIGAAGMHARWWEHADLGGMRWLGGWAHPVVQQVTVEQVGAVLPAIEAGDEYECTPYFAELCRRFLDAPERLFNAIVELPVTIVHGDFHPQNLFFADGAQGRFAAFDWQFIERGFGAYDIARLLGIGLSPALRHEATPPLLDEYQEALQANGVSAPGDVAHQYDIGLAANLLRLAPGITNTNPESFHRLDPKTGERFSDAIIGRMQTLAEERDLMRVIT